MKYWNVIPHLQNGLSLRFLAGNTLNGMQINLVLIVINRLLCGRRTNLLFGSHMVILQLCALLFFCKVPFQWEATSAGSEDLLKILNTNMCLSHTQHTAQHMDVLQTMFCTSVSSNVANVGKNLLFEMIQITEHQSQPLYERSIDLWAAVGTLLC